MDSLQLLDKVHSFYSEAFNQLIIITISILAFSGVVLPIILQIIQTRILKADQNALQNQIQDKITSTLESLKSNSKEIIDSELKTIHEKLEKDKKEYQEQLDKSFLVSQGQVQHLQGRINADSRDFSLSLVSYTNAAINFLIAEDELMANRALSQVKDVIKNVSKIDFDNWEDVDSRLTALIQLLEKNNDKGRHSDFLMRLKKEIDNAKKRIPTPVK